MMMTESWEELANAVLEHDLTHQREAWTPELDELAVAAAAQVLYATPAGADPTQVTVDVVTAYLLVANSGTRR